MMLMLMPENDLRKPKVKLETWESISQKATAAAAAKNNK